MADPTDELVAVDAVLRERLGRVVRDVWMQWSAEQPVIKPSWRMPWEHLTEPEREVDRRIGEALYRIGVLNADAHPRIKEADRG